MSFIVQLYNELINSDLIEVDITCDIKKIIWGVNDGNLKVKHYTEDLVI